MAPVVAADKPGVASKIKRPVPPGIQTNGVSSSRSSTSPLMSAKRAPSVVRQPSNPPNTNGASASSARPPVRLRRETSGQVLGRGQRSAGLRSASIVPDMAIAPAVEPRPYVVTSKYILKKYAGNPPSLVVHMHATHFRFDQQEGMFQYKSPMKIFLEHIRSRTVPHDMLEYFTQWGVPFYENCLIVQIHDHKSVSKTTDFAKPTSDTPKTTPFSIHNYNQYLTPSSYVPFPKEETVANGDTALLADSELKEKTAEERDKENMPAPSAPPEGKSKVAPRAKVYTVVLHPTQQSLQMDLAIKASTPRGSVDSRADGHGPPPTPHGGVPPTPTVSSMPPPAKKLKRERMELDSSNIYAAESQILLATTAPLDLESTKNVEDLISKLDSHAHPDHSHKPPQPKTRKRTVAEMAADEALAADQERYMLTGDERLSSKAAGVQSAASGADVDGQAGAAAWEPRFERFKVIEDIKRDHAEKKEQEKIKQQENERRLALQKQQQQAQQQQEQQAALIQQQRAVEERQRREQQAAREQQQRQEAQRRAMQAQAQARMEQAQAALNNNNPNAMGQTPHGHPAPNPAMPNGLPAGMANAMAVQAQAARFQQASQAQVSSPIVRHNTPQNMSSPMVGNVPMQQSNSGMGASPPRPSSVVQNHPAMSAPMAVSMSARGSQQSHQAGTPRMPNATPNMAQATPLNRAQGMQTPRMTQGSPPPGMMTAAQQVGQAMLMNNQGLPQQMQNQNFMAAQIAAQQHRIQQQQHMAQTMQQNGMLPGTPGNQHMTPQQQIMQQQMLRQQMLNMQRNPMPNPQAQAQLAAQYRQQLNNLQNNMQQMQGGQMPNQMQAGQMTNQMQAQLQQMQQMQQAGQMQNQLQQMQAGQMQNQMQNQLQRQMAAAQGQNMMNPNGMSQAAQIAAMQQMQQLQAQQQQQQQAAAAAQQMAAGQPAAMNPIVQQQIANQQRLLFAKNMPGLAQRFGGADNIPPEAVENLKRQCIQQARNQVLQAVQQRNAANVQVQAAQQAAMLQQQQQQQQQQAAMQGMMPQGM